MLGVSVRLRLRVEEGRRPRGFGLVAVVAVVAEVVMAVVRKSSRLAVVMVENCSGVGIGRGASCEPAVESSLESPCEAMLNTGWSTGVRGLCQGVRHWHLLPTGG